MIIEIDNINVPEVAAYASLTETQLRHGNDSVEGYFIAESPKVIKVAISKGYEPESILCERKHITGDAHEIISMFPEIKIFTGTRETLQSLTGYKLTRGVLALMKRKPLPSLRFLCGQSRLLCVLHGVTDTTNIGSIFRSASALGVDGIVLSKDTCDPLNRRSVRVSMGTVFTVPWTWLENSIEDLKEYGFATAALALSENSISLDNRILKQQEKLAVVFGTEGDGLPTKVIGECDFVVKIPMFHGVDSLNVGAAAAVTFWELRKTK